LKKSQASRRDAKDCPVDAWSFASLPEAILSFRQFSNSYEPVVVFAKAMNRL